MKNAAFLLTFFIASFSIKAQMVAINDTAFVTALNVIVPAAMTGNELDTGHPDVLNTIYLNVGDYGIADLTGVEHFENLLELSCNNNLLTELPVLPPGLTLLNCDWNQITYIEVPFGLGTLMANQNQLTGLAVDPQAALTDLYLAANSFTSVPVLPVGLVALSMAANPISELPELPQSLEYLNIRDNAAISCLPKLPDGMINLHSLNSGVHCLPNWPINLIDDPDDLGFEAVLCDNFFTNCIDPNLLGSVFNDLDNNGAWDNGEPAFPFALVLIQPNNWLTGSKVDGSYDLHVPIGNYTIEPIPGPYQSNSSNPQTANIPDANTIDAGNDLGLYTQTGIQDLMVDLSSSGEPRPGFEQVFTITYSHPGSVPVTGSVQFIFDNNLNWVSSSPLADNINGNTASWNFSDLEYGAGGVITVHLTTPVNTPLGTNVSNIASILPVVGDIQTTNNTRIIYDEVIGSFDPNDKLVEPSSLTLGELLNGERIDYTVRFQNTGSADALLVRLTDTLSTDLDWSSFQFVSSSHPCQWYLQGNILIVVYEGIDLPPSSLDEPGSHGFAKFSIKPSDQLLEGEQVHNTANIYFDFNEPIITDPAVFEVSMPTAIADYHSHEFVLWPNPAKENLWVATPTGSSGQLEVLDISGKRLISETTNTELTVIDLQDLVPGSYVVRWNSENGVLTQRFIKL